MLDLIVLNGAAACANGNCPQQIMTYTYTPQVVAVASVVPGKTVVQYKRNIFGRLVPTYATVTTEIASSEAKTAKESKGTCKGGCK